jgi:hypothetical protein
MSGLVFDENGMVDMSAFDAVDPDVALAPEVLDRVRSLMVAAPVPVLPDAEWDEVVSLVIGPDDHRAGDDAALHSLWGFDHHAPRDSHGSDHGPEWHEVHRHGDRGSVDHSAHDSLPADDVRPADGWPDGHDHGHRGESWQDPFGDHHGHDHHAFESDDDGSGFDPGA